MTMAAKMEPDHNERLVISACRSHCGGACLLKIHVKDGIITKIETDDGEEPQHRACARGRAYRQRVYAPDRLMFPLKRVGERGSGEFARISWDEALDTVVSEIKRVEKAYGRSAIAFTCSTGDLVWLHNAGLVARLLTEDGGYSGVWGAASNEAEWFSAVATYGTEGTSPTRDDLLNSRLIILWGWDPANSRGYGNPAWYLAQAREAGARIVSVDPRYTDSAANLAHQWIPVRPGTDAAMLIAMAYVMIKESLHDQKFLDTYTTGFDKFRDYVLGKEDNIPKTPAWAENITGVSAATITGLAREYATMKPAALVDSFAAGRSAYGEQFHRAAATLAAMTGNIGISGGNAPSAGSNLGGACLLLRLGPDVVSRMKGSMSNPIDLTAPHRSSSVFYQKVTGGGLPAWYKGGPSSALVHRILLADAILKGREGGYPADYKLLYIVNNNYVNQYANTNKIIQALKTLEFIVVQEQFMTATARYADIVLPTNTYMERKDVTTGGVGLFYGYVNKAVDSLGESKSHFEIATELAARLGIHDFTDKSEEEWLREIVEGCQDIPEYDTFKKEGIHRIETSTPSIAFEEQIKDPVNNPFPTPSGKIEIYSQQLADMDNPLIPPIPKYIEAWESYNDPLTKQYPLQLVTTHTKRRAHTQFENLPWLRELYPQVISINTADAQARGIKDGDMVRVFNDRGEMIIPAKLTESIMPGVVDIPQGAWHDPDENGVDRGGCANILTKDIISPAGSFCSNTALVQIELA